MQEGAESVKTLADLRRGDPVLLDGRPVTFLACTRNHMFFTRDDGTDVAVRIADCFSRVSLQARIEEVINEAW